MPSYSRVPADVLERYEVHERRHGIAILDAAHPQEWLEILDAIRSFRLLRSDIARSGGRKSAIAVKIDRALLAKGWKEKAFDTRIIVDETEYIAPTHAIDCYKNRIALQVEWNTKDTFFDRDLNNFRLLFELRAIDVGVIITRCDELQPILSGVRKSYTSTTFMLKLLPRIDGGAGGGCPIVVFGIKKENYIDDR